MGADDVDMRTGVCDVVGSKKMSSAIDDEARAPHGSREMGKGGDPKAYGSFRIVSSRSLNWLNSSFGYQVRADVTAVTTAVLLAAGGTHHDSPRFTPLHSVPRATRGR